MSTCLLPLALLAFGNILNGADIMHSMPPAPDALKISKSMDLYPTDLAAPPKPMLKYGGILGSTERRFDKRPNHFDIVRMDQLHEIFDMHLVFGKIEYFLNASIPREYPMDSIVLERPKPGRIKGKLQAIFACLQGLLRPLTVGDVPNDLRHDSDFALGIVQRRHHY
jgi:hypothetical protein